MTKELGSQKSFSHHSTRCNQRWWKDPPQPSRSTFVFRRRSTLHKARGDVSEDRLPRSSSPHISTSSFLNLFAPAFSFDLISNSAHRPDSQTIVSTSTGSALKPPYRPNSRRVPRVGHLWARSSPETVHQPNLSTLGSGPIFGNERCLPLNRKARSFHGTSAPPIAILPYHRCWRTTGWQGGRRVLENCQWQRHVGGP